VQIHREHNLLALNLGLKYEIQVPNIGDMHWGPQPSYWEFRPPIAPPWVTDARCVRVFVWKDDGKEDSDDVQANTSRQLARSQTEVHWRSAARPHRTPRLTKLLCLDRPPHLTFSLHILPCERTDCSAFTLLVQLPAWLPTLLHMKTFRVLAWFPHCVAKVSFDTFGVPAWVPHCVAKVSLETLWDLAWFPTMISCRSFGSSPDPHCVTDVSLEAFVVPAWLPHGVANVSL